MPTKSKLFSAGALALLSTAATATPGHDHTHWLSQPVHLLSSLAVGAIVIALVWYKTANNQKQVSTSIVDKD